MLIIKFNFKEIDGVPVTGIPVGSGTVLQIFSGQQFRFISFVKYIKFVERFLMINET